MNVVCVPKPCDQQSLSALRVPYLNSARRCSDDPAETPVKEPTTVPTTPDVEPEPNTIPHRPSVPEPDVGPCERPDTSCPVHR